MLKTLAGIIVALVVVSLIIHGHNIDTATGSSSSPSSTSTASTGADQQSNDGVLRIEGVALGPFQERPCEPKRDTSYPYMLVCEIEANSNRTTVTFSDDGTKIVRVDRYQPFDDSDYKPQMLLAAAVDHYGKPDVYSPDNWLAIYGNAFTTTQNGDRIDTDWASSGTGLEIKVHWCPAGNPNRDFVCDSTYHTYVAEYELLDAGAYNEAKSAAEAWEQNQENAADRAKQQKAAGSKF